MWRRRVADSPRNERGGQVSHLLLAGGDFGSRHLSVTWVECAPGSQQEMHAHRSSEQTYVIIDGRGEMIVGEEHEEIGRGTLVLIPPGQPHAIRNIADRPLVYVSATSPPFPVERQDKTTWLPSERSLSA